MHRGLLILLGLAALSGEAFAGMSIVVVAENRDIPVSESLDVDADFVTLPVTIRSYAKQPDRRLDEVRQLGDALLAAAGAREGVEIRQGSIEFSAARKSSFSLSKSSGPGSHFVVLGRLAPDDEFYEVSKSVVSLVASIEPRGDAVLTAGRTQLALADPEQHRLALLERIRLAAEQATKAFGTSGSVEIAGLEGPVRVVQKNEREVSVYIDYTMKVAF